MSDEEVDTSGWLIFFGFGLAWTLVAGGIFSLIILASLGIIGVGNDTSQPTNYLMFGVMAAMFSPGPAFLYAGITSFLASSRAKSLRARFPGKPWKWSAKWNTGVIPANAAAEAFWSWYGAFFFALFLAPGFFQLVIIDPDWRALILVPFLIIDGFLFRHAFRRTRSAHRYGELGLALSQLPLQPGKSFEVLLKLPVAIEGQATVRLACTITVSRGHGKNRTTHTETLFETSREVPVVASGSNALIRAALELPTPSPSGTWTLEIKAAQVDESFELPVFEALEVERFAFVQP